MFDGHDDDKGNINGLLDGFIQDRRLVTGRRATDRKICVGNCVLAQPSEGLQYLIASNDASYLRVYLSFSNYFLTIYSAKFTNFRYFSLNFYQIKKHLKILRKFIATAIFGVFLFVPNQYQVTHSPT